MVEELANKGLHMIEQHIEENNDLFLDEIINLTVD